MIECVVRYAQRGGSVEGSFSNPRCNPPGCCAALTNPDTQIRMAKPISLQRYFYATLRYPATAILDITPYAPPLQKPRFSILGPTYPEILSRQTLAPHSSSPPVKNKQALISLGSREPSDVVVVLAVSKALDQLPLQFRVLRVSFQVVAPPAPSAPLG